MKKIKVLIFFLLAFSWVAAMFIFSGQDYFQSNDLSNGLIQLIVSNLDIEITDMRAVNKVVRKIFHVFLFMVLAIFIFVILQFLKKNIKKSSLITFILCIFFAGVDEYHQKFVPARTSSVTDVVIDAAGSLIGILLCVIVSWLYSAWRRRKKGKEI